MPLTNVNKLLPTTVKTVESFTRIFEDRCTSREVGMIWTNVFGRDPGCRLQACRIRAEDLPEVLSAKLALL